MPTGRQLELAIITAPIQKLDLLALESVIKKTASLVSPAISHFSHWLCLLL